MRTCRLLAGGSLFLLAVCAALPVLRAQTPPAAASAPPAATRIRATTRTVPATVLAVTAGTVRLTLEGAASPVSALLDEDSVFFRKGKTARSADFPAGEKVTARLTFRADGSIVIRSLYDQPSYEAYTRDRREVCVGTVGTNVAGHLQVRRADGSTLLFRATDKTQVRRRGVLAKLTDYPVGSPVAVRPRSLPSGDIMAAIVAESAAEVGVAHLDGLVNWEGTVEAVDAAQGHLTLRRHDGVSRPIAIAPTARLRRGKTGIPLKDITPGTAVQVHLLRGADANGLRTADAVSVIVPREPRTAKP